MGVTPFTRREWIRSSVCLVNCWFGWDLLCMSLLTSVINVLSLSFSSLPSPLWPFCFDLGLLLADATWHLRKRRSAFEKMLPPNAPETQEIITTQASWTKQTVLLHFSTFWQQFKIPHTFLFWRLPTCDTEMTHKSVSFCPSYTVYMYEVLGTFMEKGPTLGLEVPLAILIQTPPHLVLVCSAPNHLNPTSKGKFD